MSTETLASLKQMKADYMAKVKAEGQSLLKAAFAEFFAAHPDIEAIRWAQYTPYFNDGDSCTFGVHEPKVSIKDVPAGVKLPSDGDDGFFSGYGLELLTKGVGHYANNYRDWIVETPATDADKATGARLDAAWKALGDFWKSISDDELFELTFGDHQQITASAEGFQVDDYEHD